MKKTLTFVLVAVLMTFAGVQTVLADYGYGGGGVSYGSMSGGSSYAAPAPVVTPTVAPVTPVVGKVLGASNFRFTTFIRQGVASDDVKQLQERLRAEGYFTFPTSTGFFGPITLASVKAYQTDHGLPSTGFVGALTTAELNK